VIQLDLDRRLAGLGTLAMRTVAHRAAA